MTDAMEKIAESIHLIFIFRKDEKERNDENLFSLIVGQTIQASSKKATN